MKGWDRGALKEPEAEEQKEEHHGKWFRATARAAEIHKHVSHMTSEPRLSVYRWRSSTWDLMFWSRGWAESSLELRSQRTTCWVHDLQNRRWSLMLLIFSMNRYIHSADPEPTPPGQTRQNQTYKTVVLWGGGRWSTKGPGHRRFPSWGSDGNNNGGNLVKAPSLYKPPAGDFRRGPPVCAAVWKGSSEVTERRFGWRIQ